MSLRRLDPATPRTAASPPRPGRPGAGDHGRRAGRPDGHLGPRDRRRQRAWRTSAASRTAPTPPPRRAPLVLASRLAGATTPGGGWDSSVNAAIVASAAANSVTIEAAYYTDICGIPLKADGTASLTGGGVYDFSNAKQVGTGMPNPTSTTPDCPSLTVGPVSGVLVKTHRDVDTYFARVLGINTMPVGAITTAAAGLPAGVVRGVGQRVVRAAPGGDAGEPGLVRREQQRRRHGRAVVFGRPDRVPRAPVQQQPGERGLARLEPQERRHERADRRARQPRPTARCRSRAGSTSRRPGTPTPAASRRRSGRTTARSSWSRSST